MPFDAPVVACLIQELQKLLPVKIDKIHQPYPDEFLFSCFGNGESFKLLISLNSKFARIHTFYENKQNPCQPSSFCMLLRKHFSGSKLVSVMVVPFERIIKLSFDVYDQLEGLSQKHLWIEFTGKAANMFVVDRDNRIIDSWKRLANGQDRERDLSNGSKYELPPTGGRWKPVTLSETEFIALIENLPHTVSLEQLLLKNWYGLSSLTCNELITRAKLNPAKLCCELTLTEIKPLYQTFINWSTQIETGQFEPCGIYNQQGILIDCAAISISCQQSEHKVKPADSLNQLVSELLNTNQEKERFREQKANLARKIKQNLDKDLTKLEKQQKEVNQAEQGDLYRIMGELLITYGYQITKGSPCAKLVNHYDPDGEVMEIKLDPSLTPHENAQVYFKKYQKAKKGLEAIALQIQKTKESITYLESLEALTENALTTIDLEMINDEFQATYGKQNHQANKSKQSNNSKKEKEKENLTKPRQFTTPAGHTILVGRNNLQNDRLTFKTAAPTDLWFHTQKIPGSHVILKPLPGTEVDEETLSFASQLAVYFSKARNSTKVPVDYTQRKNVKKPPGAKPGFVIYDHFKTAIITPDPTILKMFKIEN